MSSSQKVGLVPQTRAPSSKRLGCFWQATENYSTTARISFFSVVMFIYSKPRNTEKFTYHSSSHDSKIDRIQMLICFHSSNYFLDFLTHSVANFHYNKPYRKQLRTAEKTSFFLKIVFRYRDSWVSKGELSFNRLVSILSSHFACGLTA